MFGDLFDEDAAGGETGERGGGGGRKSIKTLVPPEPRGRTRISGIRNQGATCYLNALLQTLIHTPEFREQLFSLGPEELGCLTDKDKPDAKVRVIPLELQKLFAHLLLADEQAASTTELTDSFGWTNREELGQQDVQELNRILFSALESSLVGTSGSGLIQQLYHGTTVNHVTCSQCGYISERQEGFLDLTVCVRGVCGLEEALWSMFVEEEVFEGSNLYHCARCDRLVHATKSAKLRKLPPFLTVSLLRFSFDFSKCERFKETSSYSFPLSINLRPFCEQSDLPDSEFCYELFSVIIHKGGCHGGHYHAYIKDIDQLGHWEAPEEDVKTSPQKKASAVSESETTVEQEDDPLSVLSAILAQEAAGSVLVDQLGQKVMDRVGSSWNRKYRKQFGPISKFLKSRPETFLLLANGTRVALKPADPNSPAQNGVPAHTHLANDIRVVEREAGPGVEPGNGGHWFDLNDSTVTAIRERDISKQFEGRESAYMLFYRKTSMHRPDEARGNPAYGIPAHLLEMLQEENVKLQQRRAEFEASSNSVEIRLHLAECYCVRHGALQPLSSDPNTDPNTAITFDRRRTVGELRLALYQMQELWEGDMALTTAKKTKAGLHLYHTLTDDQLSLYSAGLSNGSELFVWNGKELNGEQVQVGSEWEPVLLTIVQPCGAELDAQGVADDYPEGGATEEDGAGLVQSMQRFGGGVTLGAVREALTTPDALVCQEAQEAGPDGGGASRWRVCPAELMRKTLRELTLRDEEPLLLLNPDRLQHSRFSLDGDIVTVTTPSDCRWLHVELHSPAAAAEEEEEEEREESRGRKIPASGDTLVGEVKERALEEMNLQEHFRGVSCCLRQIDRSGKLLPPVCEELSVRDAGIKLMSRLYLCAGRSPKASQLFLYFRVDSTGALLELVVEESLTVQECMRRMLEAAGLQGECWHLRRMDWCEEVGEALVDETASLQDVKLSHGDTLVLTEGKLPPKGFLKLAVWWCDDLVADGTFDTHTAGWQMSAAGFVEISEEASLDELRCLVLTLPQLQDVCVPTPQFLRVWQLEAQRPCRVLRGNQHTLRKLKLGSGSEVLVQKLQCEEDLGCSDLLLRVQVGVAGERAYFPAQEFVWEAGRDSSPRGLYLALSRLYGSAPEHLLLAKHLPLKHSWMPIHNWTQQVSKRKKKKKVESVQSAPYCLRDGDLIGVKNLLVDSNREFHTLQDEQGQQRFREEAEKRRKGGQPAGGPSGQDAVPEAKSKAGKHRKPEVALSISVGEFR